MIDFKLSWETFKNNLCDGFSKLQQMQEFVDVTLAAGGHYVKAHQNVIAVASPYLKEMLKSTPCQHPVIFLGPVNHTVLSFILEYMYTGEVNVPSHVLPAFVEAAKLLQIAGVKDIHLPQIDPHVNAKKPKEVVKEISEGVNTNTLNNRDEFTSLDEIHNAESEVNSLVNNGRSSHSDNYTSTTNPVDFRTDHTSDDTEKCHMDLDFENLITFKNVPTCPNIDTQTLQKEAPANACHENGTDNVEFNNYNSAIDDEINQPSASSNNDASGISNKLYGNEDITTTALYTRSNRGSLQMIMNRFIYYLHHTSCANQKRRWRCIDYRKRRCTAYIDTNCEIIVNRKNLHNHSFHDKEIFKIGKKKEIFTSISEANSRCCQHKADDYGTAKIIDKNTEQKKYEIAIEFPITN